MDDLVQKALAGYGLLGAVCTGLLFVIRTLWRKIEDLQGRIDALRREQLSERDALVKALSEQTTALGEASSALEAVAARRMR